MEKMLLRTKSQYLFLLFFSGIVFLIICCCSCSNLHGEDQTKKEATSEQKIREKIITLLKELNLYGFEQFSKETDVTIEKIPFYAQKYAAIYKCEIGKIRFRFNADNLGIIELFNGYADEKTKERKSEEDNHKKQQDSMTKLAQSLVVEIIGYFPKGIRIDAEWAKRDSPIDHGDVWTIRWVRFAGEYNYPYDFIVVTISEQYGLIEYYNSLCSNEVDTTIKITSREAIRMAKKKLPLAIKQYCEKVAPVLQWGDFLKDFEYYSVNIYKGKPSIINIGYIMPFRETEPITSTKKLQATFAWPVAFDSPFFGLFIVYIGAKDGEYLGFLYMGN